MLSGLSERVVVEQAIIEATELPVGLKVDCVLDEIFSFVKNEKCQLHRELEKFYWSRLLKSL